MHKDYNTKRNQPIDLEAKESNLQIDPVKEEDLKEIAGGKKLDVASLISTTFKILRK